MYTREQVIREIERYGRQVHSGEVVAAWDDIDSYYNRQAEIELPEVVRVEGGDGLSLERLYIRTNFAKIIVSSTATMAMASGIRAYDDKGAPDLDAPSIFQPSDIRRLLRNCARYGAAWLQVMEGDDEKPYRVYKPHVARRIMEREDPEKEHAILVVQAFRDTDDEEYHVARWYEWDDDRRLVVRQDYVTTTTSEVGWMLRGKPQVFRYMPWLYVPNRIEDSIPEQSDIIDGLDIFKQYDALRTKFLKALEDESFRLIFLANVSEEVAKRIKRAGGLQIWYAKNKRDEAPPELQSVPPADQRQFLDAFRDLVNSLATVTRTSVLELNERPVQDIPAQTLRVLYGPQIERCNETVEHVNPALTKLMRILSRSGADSRMRVELKPRLPVSEDKIHQNLKGLLDSNAFSAFHLLVEGGKTPAEAEEIIARRLEEKQQLVDIDTASEVAVAEARGVRREGGVQ